MMVQPYQHQNYLKWYRPLTLPALVVLALANRQLINAHSAIKMVEENSGGPIYITQSHARYVLSRLEAQGYIKRYLSPTHSHVKNFTITDRGKQKLKEDVESLRHTYNSVKFLASFYSARPN